MRWTDIQGWWNDNDHTWYRKTVEEAPPRAHFVEVGSWLGRSAASMATSISDFKKDIRFDCVDTWKGTPPEGDAGYHQRLILERGLDLREAFERHLTDLGLRSLVHPVEGDSAEVASTYPDRSLDLVFIDGDHRRESVARDVRAWLPKLRYGGLIAGHDATAENVISGVTDGGIQPAIEGRIWRWRNRLPIRLPERLSDLTWGPLAQAVGISDATPWFGPMASSIKTVLSRYVSLDPEGLFIGDCTQPGTVTICPCDTHKGPVKPDLRRSTEGSDIFPAFPHGDWPFLAPTWLSEPSLGLSVGFCGVSRPALRIASLEALRSAPVPSEILIREGFHGAGVPPEVARKEYWDILLENPYQLCVRGVGNYCYRLYETLAAGRVPILVGERPLPWPDLPGPHVVRVSTKELLAGKLADRLLAFHEEGDLAKKQRQNRDVWLDYLSPVGWWREWVRRR